MITLHAPQFPTNPQQNTHAGELADKLADDIVNGRLLPGVRLDEQGLADRFGVSRTPVREALGQLAAMGLAEKQPHRGVYVRVIPPEMLDEMFEVMGEFEAACARYAAQRMTTQERRDLETLHQSSAELVRQGDADSFSRHNHAFHSAIYKGTHNQFLEETARAYRRRLAPFRRAQFNVLGRLADSYVEHEDVVREIVRGNQEKAAAAMRRHVVTVSHRTSDLVYGSQD